MISDPDLSGSVGSHHIRYLSVLAFLVGACDSTGHYYLQKEAHEHAAEWGYEGATGPEHWGDLSPEYRLAKEGKNQSPINIDTTLVERATLPELNLRYGMERPVFLNNTPGEKLELSVQLILEFVEGSLG